MSQNPESAADDIEARQSIFAAWANNNFVPPTRADYLKGGSLKPTYNTALAVLEKFDWGFAYNELDLSYVLRADPLPWAGHYDRKLTDDTLRVIRNFLLLHCGVELKKEHVLDACLSLARATPFNPVVEYLERAEQEWDGESRVANWLSTYLGVKVDDENRAYVSAVGSIFLVGAVARANVRESSVKFDTILILEGHTQGKGKSTALKILGGPWYSDAELGNVRDKDAAHNLQGVWIQELPELGTIARSDLNAMKAFASREVDKFRAPYDAQPNWYPRHCVFAATTNESAYLIDPTGNRRYLPVETGDLELEALARDRDQLWGEAVAMWRTGFSTVLPEELWAFAAEQQQARTVEEPWAEKIDAYLAKHPGEVTTGDLLTDAIGVDLQQQNSGMAKKVAGILSRMGWRRQKVRRGERTVWVFRKA